MEMARAETRLSMILTPAYAIAAVVSKACISLEGLDDKKADGAPISKTKF